MEDKETRSRTMSRIRSKDTKPEMTVRRLVHAMGFRYRLHRKDLPGKPDLVFASRNKVIFVHGCFWHGHGCKRDRMPSSRQEYWRPKLEGNQRRDREHADMLAADGWNVLTLWECELKDQEELGRRIIAFLATEAR